MTAHHVLPTYKRADLEPVRGEGCYLFDASGRRYLDFLAGVAVNAFGHCHPRMVEALCRQANLLWHSSNLVEVPGQEAVAARLCAACFADQVFFTNSGTESVDYAMKLVRRFSKTTDNPGRWRTITFTGGFHGRTMAAIAAGGQPKLMQGYEPVVPGFDCVPFGDLHAVEAAIGPETAAIFFEPIQGEGGVRVLPDDALRGLRAIADRHGLLLVVDEVQTGFGRTGELFGFSASGITPDIVACAKALGAGFPLGAVLTTEAVGRCVTPGSHGSTLGGSPLAMAVAAQVLDMVLADGFLDGVRDCGNALHAALASVAAEFPDVLAGVRGRGLMLGLECKDVLNTDFMTALRHSSLLSAPAGDNVVRLLPPLIISVAQVAEAARAVAEACRMVAGGRAGASPQVSKETVSS